jgi:hypothetical protein
MLSQTLILTYIKLKLSLIFYLIAHCICMRSRSFYCHKMTDRILTVHLHTHHHSRILVPTSDRDREIVPIA